MVSEDLSKVFFNYVSIGVNYSNGMANVDPWVMVGRVQIGEHYALQHTILREKSLAICYNAARFSLALDLFY